MTYRPMPTFSKEKEAIYEKNYENSFMFAYWLLEPISSSFPFDAFDQLIHLHVCMFLFPLRRDSFPLFSRVLHLVEESTSYQERDGRHCN